MKMSKQVHYVVVYDDEDKSWTIDFDVSINYDNGNVWDTDLEEWTYVEDEEDVLIQDLNERLSK